MKYHLLLFILLGIILASFRSAEEVYLIEKGKVYFKSSAPLEIIEANSESLKGAIDLRKRTFAFSIEILSFQGFNSALQREHFNENYMESDKYETATFLGRIIEKEDLSKDGIYQVRAKGKLKVHGVEQERIIKSKVTIKNGKLSLQSQFSVFLKEHEITIPKIVHQKIAEEIQVKVTAELVRSSS